MPLSKHYGGDGEEVASSMQKKYGSDWKKYFYGHENALKKKKKKGKDELSTMYK